MTERGQLLYLDSSAIVKLINPEPETEALFEYLEAWPDLISSEMARVEVLRAARRISEEAPLLQRAGHVLETIHLVEISPEILSKAGKLEPVSLRTLDAIHLSTALELRPDLGAFIAYDQVLLKAARFHSLITESPI